jgi:hypothetical protein
MATISVQMNAGVGICVCHLTFSSPRATSQAACSRAFPLDAIGASTFFVLHGVASTSDLRSGKLCKVD